MASRRRSTDPRPFTVVGSGRFPIDMLRYDACWPASSTDSEAVQHSMAHGTDRDVYTVRLTQAAGYHAPTDQRWASYGWIVQ